MLVYLVQIQHNQDIQYLFSRNIALYNECYSRRFSAEKYALRYFYSSNFCNCPYNIIPVEADKDYSLNWDNFSGCL